MKTISRILVPLDFGQPSLDALDDAIDLAATLGASVVVMHAYEVSPLLGARPEGPLHTADLAEHLAATAASALTSVVRDRANRGVKLDTVVREGPAWQEIDAVAEDTRADLIVLGTHSRHGILRTLLGNVAERVVRTARKPVLTIRAAEA